MGGVEGEMEKKSLSSTDTNQSGGMEKWIAIKIWRRGGGGGRSYEEGKS